MERDTVTCRSNAACYPKLYKEMYDKGRKAAKTGQPKSPPDCFEYSYEGGAWLDGYEAEKVNQLFTDMGGEG